MAYTVLDIADWFLKKEEMTHKKLQKLCYYAQAWHYTLYGERLIDSDFQAWVHGPVSKMLYSEYKDYNWSLIPKKNKKINIDNDSISFLERIWATYGHMDGHELESLSHQENPWIEARNGLGQWDPSSKVITLNSMAKYYKDLYKGD